MLIEFRFIMALLLERIEQLSSTKNVDSVAVKEFFRSIETHSDRSQAHLFLDAEAATNKWNTFTRKAIRTGIREFFQK